MMSTTRVTSRLIKISAIVIAPDLALTVIYDPILFGFSQQFDVAVNSYVFLSYWPGICRLLYDDATYDRTD